MIEMLIEMPVGEYFYESYKWKLRVMLEFFIDKTSNMSIFHE